MVPVGSMASTIYRIRSVRMLLGSMVCVRCCAKLTEQPISNSNIVNKFLISADKITLFFRFYQIYLHISQKSSTFAVDFATMAQLVEQRIRNAWVAGLEAEN